MGLLLHISLTLPMHHCCGLWPNSAPTYTIVKIKRINSIKVNKPQQDYMLVIRKPAKVMPTQPRAEFVPHAAASSVAHSSLCSPEVFPSQGNSTPHCHLPGHFYLIWNVATLQHREQLRPQCVLQTVSTGFEAHKTPSKSNERLKFLWTHAGLKLKMCQGKPS